MVLIVADFDAFGTFSGLVASWFLAPAAKEADSELSEIKSMLADVQARVGTATKASTGRERL